ADLVRPGMLHAAFLRSPHAHALIRGVDTAAARSAPGVAAVLTGDDLRDRARPMRAASRMPGYTPTDMPAPAPGKARYAGEAVAIAVADSRYTAEDALDRVAVDYVPLGAVVDARRASDGGSPRVHDQAPGNVILSRAFSQGDAAAAFSRAA